MFYCYLQEPHFIEVSKKLDMQIYKDYLDNDVFKILTPPLFNSNLLVNFFIVNYLKKDLYVPFLLDFIYKTFQVNRFSKSIILQDEDNAVYECLLQLNSFDGLIFIHIYLKYFFINFLDILSPYCLNVAYFLSLMIEICTRHPLNVQQTAMNVLKSFSQRLKCMCNYFFILFYLTHFKHF